MSNPTNLIAVGGIAASKLEAMQDARKIASGWVATMKEHQMAAMVFVYAPHVPNDRGNFTLGYLDTELDEAGYLIAHWALAIVGRTESGLPAFHVTLLIRSKTGKAQSVILA